MGHDGGENLLRFDNFHQEVGPSNRRLRSPAGGKTATSRFESILPERLNEHKAAQPRQNGHTCQKCRQRNSDSQPASCDWYRLARPLTLTAVLNTWGLLRW